MWSSARFTDILRLRDGRPLIVRFLMPDDGERLLSYFRSLSQHSRYSRLMGAASELPPSELDKALHVGEGSRSCCIPPTKFPAKAGNSPRPQDG